jgi:hypothetical protein
MPFLFSFCDKSGIFQFIRALLSIEEVSTHHSLKEPPFVAVVSFLIVVRNGLLDVKSAEVNLWTERAVIDYDKDLLDVNKLKAAVEDAALDAIMQ